MDEKIQLIQQLNEARQKLQAVGRRGDRITAL